MKKRAAIPDDADELDLVDDGDIPVGATVHKCADCKKATGNPQYGPPSDSWLSRCPACYKAYCGAEKMDYVPHRPQDKRTRAEQMHEGLRARTAGQFEGDRRQIVWDNHHIGTPVAYADFLKAYYKKNAQYAPDSAITRNVNPHDHWWPK